MIPAGKKETIEWGKASLKPESHDVEYLPFEGGVKIKFADGSTAKLSQDEFEERYTVKGKPPKKAE